MSNKKKFKNGYYNLVFPEKYIQPIDRTMNKQLLPEYRSSWELKFFRFCDSNPIILRWSAEPFNIPYWSPADNKMRRYYIDGYIEFKSGDKFLVEIKPAAQTKYPKEPKKRTPRSIQKYNEDVKTYITNQAKWAAAEEFAKKNNFRFIILTEKELGV